VPWNVQAKSSNTKRHRRNHLPVTAVLLFMNKWGYKVRMARFLAQKKKHQEARFGHPTSYSNSLTTGLSHAISQVDRDAFGRKLPISTNCKMWRLRKWQIRSRVHSSIDRTLPKQWLNFEPLSQVSSPRHKRKSRRAVQKSTRQRLSRGRSINRIAAASLYAAAQKRIT